MGLIQEGEGVAARALTHLGVDLQKVRQKVVELRPNSGSEPVHRPEFTANAKTVLELGQRQALALGHDYIGTEHILLGIMRKGEGLAIDVLVSLGVDVESVRRDVMELLLTQDHTTKVIAAVRNGKSAWMWRCTCGASTIGKWRRSADAAQSDADGHLQQTAM
jgi:ATP-dependent Clp protease ATP-binding subunit ClpA